MLPENSLRIWNPLVDYPFSIAISDNEKRIIACISKNGSKNARYNINLAIASSEPGFFIKDVCSWQKISTAELTEIISQYFCFEGKTPTFPISMNWCMPLTSALSEIFYGNIRGARMSDFRHPFGPPVIWNLGGIWYEQVSNTSWCHPVFLMGKEKMNERLAECEAKFDNEGDRQQCYTDVRRQCMTRR